MTPNVNAVVNTNGTAEPASVGTVAWQPPTEVAYPELLRADRGYTVTPEDPALSTPARGLRTYRIGRVSDGLFTGGEVLLLSFYDEGPQFYPTYTRFVHRNGIYTLLAQNSDPLYDDPYEQFVADRVVVDREHVLPGMQIPAELYGPRGQHLLADRGVNALFSATDLAPVFESEYGTVYTRSPIAPEQLVATDAMLGMTNIYDRQGYYLRAPDGTVRVYYLDLTVLRSAEEEPAEPFAYGAQYPVRITWTDGTITNQRYNATAIGGCGSVNYANVVPATLVDRETDLVRSGIAWNGDSIYTLRNPSHPILQQYYTATHFAAEAYGSGKPTLADMVRNHGVVFWVDAFDRLIQLTDDRYAPLTECGKPVLYLYPTQRTDIDVRLRPMGGFSRTDPEYGSGWRVTADPDGTLTERATGRMYPYLFWEGRGGIYQTPTEGFVVAQTAVHRFLEEKLAVLGLRGREIEDFIEFWEPRMQGSPYYRVTFLGRRAMDALAPLTVTPAPDTVIRVLMDFAPLSAPVELPTQTLRAPIRTGFTVVEWGGVLR